MPALALALANMGQCSVDVPAEELGAAALTAAESEGAESPSTQTPPDQLFLGGGGGI